MAGGDPGSPRRSRRFTDRLDRPTTILEAGVTLRGALTGCGGVELAGVVEGDVEAAGLVRVRPGAKVAGRVTAQAAVIEGTVEGDIEVTGALELRPGCHVVGNLSAAAVAVAEGAFLDGRITMGGAQAEREQIAFVERRGEPD